jgi:predicted DNA-binding transcriptional regulator YafY
MYCQLMRASRLLSILLLLQARGRLTAQQLADELEVSVRTIYRDVESLHEAGIPLYGDRGHEGGYQLLNGFRTQLTGLTVGEAQAWFLAGLPGPAAQLGLGALAAAADLKIEAALPPDLREGSRCVREHLHLDAPGWSRGEGDGAGDRVLFLPQLADAVWNKHTIRVHYRHDPDNSNDPDDGRHSLQPYGLVLKAGTWYLVARSDDTIGTYRVNQVVDMDVTDDTFERADGFDLAAYWRQHLADVRSQLWQGQAVIRLSPAGRDGLRKLAATEVIDAVDKTASPQDEAGWITATVPIESTTGAHTDFLRLGADLEVLQPDDLRRQLAATARQLADLYTR